MKSPAAIVNSLAIFFIVLGVTWFACIAIRCEEISPSVVFSRGASISSASASKASTIEKREPERFRSLHAKPYHDMFFWGIEMLEIYVAIFYFFAGIFLLKRYVLARILLLLTLSLDLLLKGLVIGFMKLGAIPLSQLTHNPNLLQIYFMPSEKLHSYISAVVSGLQLYLPGGAFYFVCELVYFGFLFYLFSRQEIKDYLKAAKKY